MQTYTHYKDSGIDWIGQIPEHWECKRLGNWFVERRSKVSDKVYAPLSVTKNGIVPQLESAAKSNDGDNRKLVKVGDFVINSRSDRKGSSGLSYLDGSVSLINIVMKPRGIYPKYSEFLLKSNGFIEEFYRNGHGIVADLWTTRYDEMKFIFLAIPPTHEQEAIANFLDEKTAKIDALVQTKEQQIEKLKEVRQAKIHQAVTKGLDANAPTKDSGVEWIGEIPKHWEVKPGFSIFIENKRKNKGMIENRVLSLSYGNIIVKPLEKLVGLVPESFESYQIVQNNDIIIRCTDLQNDQKSLRIGLSSYRGIITSAYLNFTVLKDLPKYIFYFLYILDITKEIYKLGSGLRQGLNFTDFKKMLIIVPPIQEQEQIVAYLDEVTGKIDQAISQKQEQITKLKEYKQSLINDVVTGKVKVC